MRSTLAPHLVLLVLLFLVLLQESESFFSASRASSPLLRRIIRSSSLVVGVGAAEGPEDDDSIPPPPPRNGGEWEDWENESYLDDPYVFEEGDSIIPSISKELLLLASSSTADIAKSLEEESIIPSIPKELLTKSSSSWDTEGVSFAGSSSSSSSATIEGKAAVYVKNEADWVGWIEDAPYFDEEDSKLTKVS
jgi:hypothetical protein